MNIDEQRLYTVFIIPYDDQITTIAQLYFPPFQYILLTDYQSYIDTQDKVSETWRDKDLWTRMSILNVARIGKFSSDRAIQEYCQDIWKVQPVPCGV